MYHQEANSQQVMDAEALAYMAVRGAVALAFQLLAGASNPKFPVGAGPAKAETLPNDPTAKTGIAGGAHELGESNDGTMDEVLQSHEELDAPEADAQRKPMARIDGVAYHTLLGKVPDEYRDAFAPFEKLILDPDSKDEQPPLVLDEFSVKDRADVQLGVGLALIDLESILRA